MEYAVKVQCVTPTTLDEVPVLSKVANAAPAHLTLDSILATLGMMQDSKNDPGRMEHVQGTMAGGICRVSYYPQTKII